MPLRSAAATPCCSPTTWYIARRIGAVALIVNDVETRSSGIPVEDALHVGQRVDRHSDLADLARRELVIRVEPHLRGQVERDG